MFCTNCGSKLNEGARFCSSCGFPVDGGGADTSPAEGEGFHDEAGIEAGEAEGGELSQETSADVVGAERDEDATLGLVGEESGEVPPASSELFSMSTNPDETRECLNEARKNSRKRMPMLFIVVLVILGVAAVAAAAVYVFRGRLVDSPQVVEEPRVVTETPEAPSQEGAAATTSAGPANTPQAESGPHAIYNQILDDFRNSQLNSWAEDGKSELPDLYGVQRIKGGHLPSLMEASPSNLDLSQDMTAYAYYDLGGDGNDDLLIGLVNGKGESKILAIYASDGSSAVSLTNGGVADGAVWRVVSDGRLVCTQSFGQQDTDVYSQSILYSVSGAQLKIEDSYWVAPLGTDAVDRAFSYGYHGPVGDKDGSERLDDNYVLDKFDNLPNASGIDWQPLTSWIVQR